MTADPTTPEVPAECDECGSLVNQEGDALYGCAWNPPAECDTCGACYCDGSC